MEPHTLASPSLQLDLETPGQFYTGTRFDWTTQVRQIRFAGHTFLTSEHAVPPTHYPQGTGLAGEFGIEKAMGFFGCPVGGLFPKIGVGLLKRPDRRRYHFYRPYEVEPSLFEVVRPDDASAVLRSTQAVHRGYGWVLERRWSLRGTEVCLETTLKNTGSKTLATSEYIHNFLSFDGLPVDEDWELSLPRAVDLRRLREFVNPEGAMSVEGARVTWTKNPTKDFFLSDHRRPTPTTWTLRHRNGLSITETVEAATTNFNLWGRAHVVSPEVYVAVRVTPGNVSTWRRRWTFAEGVNP